MGNHLTDLNEIVHVPPAVIAHGVGRPGSLPLPVTVIVWVSAIALAAAFFAAVVRWTEPRLSRAALGRPVMAIPDWTGPVSAGVGFAVFVLAVLAGWLGDNVVYNNLLPVTLYVTVWVGGQTLAGLVGDAWPGLNPLVTTARLVDSQDDAVGASGPDWGHWPAMVGLAIFLFYELSHPSGNIPRTVAVLVTTHIIVTVIAARAWGWRWVRDHEPFTSLFATLGAMGPLHVDDRRLRLRPPLSGLACLRVRGGTAAMLLTVIGGTLFDGFSENAIGQDLFDELDGWTLAAWEAVGLALSIALVTALFGGAVWWITRVTGLTTAHAWRAFTPTLIPISVAYTVAHYVQLLADNIQVFAFRLADPFGAGWNIFGLADNAPWRIDPDVTSWIQVGALLLGHVGSVIVAYDRAVETFTPQIATRSQLGTVFAVITFSSLGVWLLLGA